MKKFKCTVCGQMKDASDLEHGHCKGMVAVAHCEGVSMCVTDEEVQALKAAGAKDQRWS